MQEWNVIVQNALVGTQKMPLTIHATDSLLNNAIETIQLNTSIDDEERFLQVAALVHQYQLSGLQFYTNQEANLPIAEKETLQYCSATAQQLLADTLLEKHDVFFNLWLQLCSTKQQIVAPHVLPQILQKAAQHKSYQPLVIECMGKRGEWLCKLNTEWQFAFSIADEEVWQTGTQTQRKKLLQQISNQNIDQAIDMLQQTWSQENAAAKTAFLEAIEEDIHSLKNTSWLEGILIEKSIQVKNKAIHLLKKIPTSSIVLQYASVLQQSISLKKEKILLGLSSKQVIEIQLTNNLPASIFSTGIQQLSNSKEFTDEAYIIYQLLQHTPPSYLEEWLQLNADTIIQFFIQQKNIQPYLSALVKSTLQFNNVAWANAIIQQSQVLYIQLMPLLSQQQQEIYSKQLYKGNEFAIIENAYHWKQEWSVEFTSLFFQFVAENPNIHGNYIYKAITNIPYASIEIIHQFSPKNEYELGVWQQTKEEIIRLLQLKQNIIQSFQ